MIQQTFDHITSDKELLSDSLQSLFALDLVDLADSFASIPDHIYLRLPKEYAGMCQDDDMQSATIFSIMHKTAQDIPIMHETAPQAPSPVHDQLAERLTQAPPPPSSPCKSDSASDLDDLLQLANQTAPLAVANQPIPTADQDSDAEFDRLLDNL